MKYVCRLTRGHLPALVLFILVTLVMTWPYPAQIQTSLYNWSDSLLNSWTLGWGTHALLTDPEAKESLRRAQWAYVNQVSALPDAEQVLRQGVYAA